MYPAHSRQTILQRNYFFTCGCLACREQTDRDTSRETLSKEVNKALMRDHLLQTTGGIPDNSKVENLIIQYLVLVYRSFRPSSDPMLSETLHFLLRWRLVRWSSLLSLFPADLKKIPGESLNGLILFGIEDLVRDFLLPPKLAHERAKNQRSKGKNPAAELSEKAPHGLMEMLVLEGYLMSSEELSAFVQKPGPPAWAKFDRWVNATIDDTLANAASSGTNIGGTISAGDGGSVETMLDMLSSMDPAEVEASANSMMQEMQSMRIS